MRTSTSRSTTRAAGAAVLALVALSVSGCGNGDDDKAAKNISASIMKSQKGSSSQFLDLKKKDADCIGKGMVAKVGTKRLQKYGLIDSHLKASPKGLTAVKMTPADAKKATDVVFGCTDVAAKAKAAIGKSGVVPRRMVSCVNRTLTERSLRTLFTRLFEGRQQEATKALTAPLTTCALGKSS
jgi:hypothetical protein